MNNIKKILKHFLPGPIVKVLSYVAHLKYLFRRKYDRLMTVPRARKNVKYVLKGEALKKHRNSIRPVYFAGNYELISFKLGGTYMIEALRVAGIPAYSAENTDLYSVKDSIIVLVKENFPKDLGKLKANGNKILIDMRDNFILEYGAFNPDFIGRDIADVIMFPNEALLKKFIEIKPTVSACEIMYGFADPAITLYYIKKGYKEIDKLQCCYFGFGCNIDKEFLTRINNITSVELIDIGGCNFREYLKRLSHFNMHIDYRPNAGDSMYKPLTKILIAAKCRANIIIKKTPRILELLPEDYPYLADDNNIESVMRKAYTTFGGDEWNYALNAMERIDRELSFKGHIDKFITILEKLS